VLLDVILPYGIAIKIIAVIGLLTLPYVSWLFGRFAKFAYPIPELFAIAATIFLFDESFTIYGGNIASTMAGEFSFSIALSLAMLGFALLAKGLDTGKHRVSSAIIISLSALSHGIVLDEPSIHNLFNKWCANDDNDNEQHYPRTVCCVKQVVRALLDCFTVEL